jgi:hypothetical protein
VDDALSIRVAAADAPGWYQFSGWDIGLSSSTAWRLVLNGTIDADLVGLRVESAAMAGSGTVRLGPPPDSGASLVVAGDFRLVVPSDVPVTVTGPADTPGEWLDTADGAASPESVDPGPEWSIDIQGDTTVRVVEG